MMNELFSGKKILITGGTGSFGDALLKRVIPLGLSEIRIFSRDEKKQDDMRQKYQNSRLNFYIGDVRDRQSVAEAVRGIDYIFHAAALKQVPSCEFFPMEAVRTNIIGTSHVIAAALAEGVKKVVFLSTDKAAYPINAMGMSKALMEKNVFAQARKQLAGNVAGTVLCCTRYGNVAASRGSVIPLFIRQIKEGKPVTVTNPEMTRFFMSLDEAVDLVLYAFENGKQGDLFVQQSPAATVGILAESIKEIFKCDTPVKVIGTRHGEKLYETLLTREEFAQAEDLGNYYRVPLDSRELEYAVYEEQGNPSLGEHDYNSHNTQRLNKEETIEKLLGLSYVPEIQKVKNEYIDNRN